MLAPFLLRLAIPLALTLFVGRILARRTTGLPVAWKGLASVAMAVCLFLFFGFLSILAGFTMDSGGWSCRVCDKPAYKVYFLGLLVGNSVVGTASLDLSF